MDREHSLARLRAVVTDVLATEIGPEDMDKGLEQLGINSIIFIKLVVQLEKEFQVVFDDTDLSIDKYENLLEIQNYIDSLIVCQHQ
jgi:phosphopantetheine attachment domain protein